MSDNSLRQDPAFSAMTLDILHNVLSRADNPGRLVDYLTEEIRELTGARCVLFLQCMDDSNRILGVNPSRHRAWAESSQRQDLYKVVLDLATCEVWDPQSPCEASRMLEQDGFGLSMAVPLHVGRVRVGAMLVLGLPDQQHIASEIKLLTTLATIVALVLRNAFLFENQEQTIAKRTKELALSDFTINNMQDCVYWIRPDARLWKVNTAACRMLEYSNDELLQLSLKDIAPAFPMESWEVHWQKLKVSGSLHLETAQRTKDGSEVPVDIIENYIELDGKEYNCAIVRNISERKRVEAESRRLQEQLLQARKMESVGRLAGGVAHDFNNMLGVILGHTEILMEDIDPTLPIYLGLQEVRRAAERSAALTRQLLAFARKQVIAPRVLDLNETIEGMLTLLRRLIGENIELAWLPGRGLWPVKMDPAQIDQILANLCVNARDAIAVGGNITIRTDCVDVDEGYSAGHVEVAPGRYVLLAVSDNGCGMGKDTLDNLFEPFFTTKEVGKGTGLGLATIFGIVKQNSGFINVYSELGQGTTFKIYIPRFKSGTSPADNEAETEGVRRGHETILLVEDEPTMLKMTRQILERLGYIVLVASKPSEAIDHVRKNPGRINLLITDVVMPEMNGRDLVEHLKSIWPDLKAIFMSGYTADVIAHHGVLDTSIEFIEKPFTKRDLAAKVRKTLDQE